jgi:predicted component of type VI protein secretion system
MRITIECMTGSLSGKRFVFEKPQITLGRGELPNRKDIDFADSDKGVSRNHGELIERKGVVYFRDHSRAGTLINGRLILSEETQLWPGDELCLGGKKGQLIRVSFQAPITSNPRAETHVCDPSANHGPLPDISQHNPASTVDVGILPHSVPDSKTVVQSSDYPKGQAVAEGQARYINNAPTVFQSVSDGEQESHHYENGSTVVQFKEQEVARCIDNAPTVVQSVSDGEQDSHYYENEPKPAIDSPTFLQPRSNVEPSSLLQQPTRIQLDTVAQPTEQFLHADSPTVLQKSTENMQTTIQSKMDNHQSIIQ